MILSVIQPEPAPSPCSESAPSPSEIRQFAREMRRVAREVMVDYSARRATVRDASAAVGGLSNPEKMPGYSYGLPASRCRVGGRLARIPGSVCFGCYAADSAEWFTQNGRNAYLGRYKMPNVRDAASRRLATIDTREWAGAFAALLNAKLSGKGWADRVFRWHDSGDLQGWRHYVLIRIVCELTPDIRHWLPTRETTDVRRVDASLGNPPANLVVRVSAAMVDGKAPVGFANTSTVHKSAEPAGVTCPAYRRDGRCESCRACWSAGVSNVSYPQH